MPCWPCDEPKHVRVAHACFQDVFTIDAGKEGARSDASHIRGAISDNFGHHRLRVSVYVNTEPHFFACLKLNLMDCRLGCQ